MEHPAFPLLKETVFLKENSIKLLVWFQVVNILSFLKFFIKFTVTWKYGCEFPHQESPSAFKLILKSFGTGEDSEKKKKDKLM